MGKSGIRKAYETGKGSITLRAKVEIESDKSGKQRIVATEIPYMVNKAKLIERIADLAREKRIEGITDVNDESDREGMRIVVDVRRDASAEVILNNLYKMTLMQTSFGFNMLAIVNGSPKVLSLKEILQYYLAHQLEVIQRRTAFELKKAEARAHILEGLKIALDHIDEIISIIRGSQTADVAKTELMSRFPLSDKQAQAILDMRLVRLTGLERDKVEHEFDELQKSITDYKAILASRDRQNQIIYEELLEIQEKFGDARRTELMVGEVLSLEDEDLIEEENVMVSLTHNGYIKRLPTTEFKAQNRGGRGIQGMGIHDDDFIEHLISTSTHDVLLFFTNAGKVYRMKGYEIPEYGRSAKGIPIINLLNIDSKERIQAVINVSDAAGDQAKFLFFTTLKGTVKRTPVDEFSNIRSNGLKALNLKDDDELINVSIVDSTQNMIIGTHSGYAVSFQASDVRSMGRSATGVRGVRLRDDDYVVGSAILGPTSNVFVISEKGYGKQTPADEYAIKGRGGKGIKTINITEKNGPLAGLTTVNGEEDIMLITDKGVMIRFGVENVSQTGRATLGVHLIRLDDDSKVATMAVVEKEEPDDGDDAEGATPTDGGGSDGDASTITNETTSGTDTSLDRLLNAADADDDDDTTNDSDDTNDSDSGMLGNPDDTDDDE